ncbi:MAG: FecR domain-containing protein [Gammaproteobacteria bacterium]|nr:FecR domain-containing protein [Gammaproteobacteria bacterium]
MKIRSLCSHGHVIKLLMLVGVLMQSSVSVAATDIGYVDYARGVVTAQHHEAGSRIMGKSARVFESDTITTANRSFAIIKMKDGSHITIRPNSSLSVEKYIARNSANDSAILHLFKGGIRAITGFISKKRVDAFKIKTSVATIGIRGTEFDARLCMSDCANEAKRYGKNKTDETQFVTGRIAFLRGQLSATDKHKKTRQLFNGGPLYEGDTLKTGLSSFAVLAFKDKSRITLQSDSIFEIKKMYFEEDKPDLGSSFMILIRGGLRAVSGLIGRTNKNAYKMQTPVATIGIRGTGYDIQCEGDCVAESPKALLTPLEQILNALIKPAIAAFDGEGMYAHVWSGAIELQNNAGSQIIKNSQTAFLSNMNSLPRMLPEVPFFMRSTPAPRPDKVEISRSLFKENEMQKTEPGLYVSVYDGHVSVTDTQGGRVDLGKGEAGFAGEPTEKPAAALRLNGIPAFQSNDAYPRPESFSESWENLFNDATNSDENKDLECSAQ